MRWAGRSTRKAPQIIRAAAILQMLLGNIGRPGGGILALRGHASIQGSTDIPTLYDILPGYLPMPFVENSTDTWEGYVKKHKARTGLWANFEKYIVSLMRAYYGDADQQGNDWGFDWLPRVTGDQSALRLYHGRQADGKMDGMFVMGENPAVGSPNGAAATESAEQAEVAGGARHGGNGNGELLEAVAGN